MSDLVTYKTYFKGKVVESRKNAACFRETFISKWDYIIFTIRTTENTKDFKKQWLELLQKVEPKLKIINENEVKLPYLKTKGKTLLILSLIRYLFSDWYWETIPISFKIIKKIKDIDPFEAIILAASSTTKGSGWGHSIVNQAAHKIVRTWHYRRYKNDRIYPLFHGDNSYPNDIVLNKIRKEMKNNLDIKPVLKHYGYIK